MKKLPVLIKHIQSRAAFDEFHDIEHWEVVERNGVLLARYDADINLKVVRYFAYLHDSCIENEFGEIEYYEHGKRAAEFCDEIRDTYLSSFSDEEFSLLRRACEFHTTELSLGDITIDTCFDADRLDLPRVGIQPIASRMASLKGKEFADNYESYLTEYNELLMEDISKNKRKETFVNQLLKKLHINK